ncbi:hypothetical protein VTL71DRAFT_16370 [Oculimacula yallundae]|uniref:Pentatricopeptide repeat protein n=1 Tax=Oculimacula yallundae TaxID=86028 RepID=A0ABR4CE88_9HELO
MLTCSGCMRHCLQTILGESTLLTAGSSRPAFTSLSKTPLRRSYTETSYERSRAGQEARKSRNAETYPYNRSQAGKDSGRNASGSYGSFKDKPAGRASGSFGNHSSFQSQFPPRKTNDTSPRMIERRKWLDSRGIRPLTKKREPKVARTDAEIRKHLTYLNDPLKLADFVRQTLRRDEFEFAQEIVRAASKNTMCVVSWNHLVEWQLSRGKMNAAISTYNEMKKRAQVPDAYTYTILFRGCAEHKDSGVALPKVMDIYNSMLDEKSPIKPNTIHMNCVLKMCARADNMDALFGIAGQFSRHGLTAPNNLSFTIILNALRMNAVGAARGDLSPMEKRARIRQSIARSRDVWADIIERWRKGDMWIDEELVSTMGRLLLVGEDADKDDVFSLIEQTMNIPRQVPKLGTPDRARIEPAKQHESMQAPQQTEETSTTVLNADGEEVPSASGPRFSVIEAPKTKEDGIAMYAKPGQNSLSLLLQAALDLRLKAPATAYWTIFTSHHLVQPDSANYHAYLRILRMSRASTELLSILSLMSSHDIETKTFRLSMSTCFRDKKNPNSFGNAEKVLDLMTKHLLLPDPQSLEHYLEIAIDCPSKATSKIQNAQGQQILHALSRLHPSFLALKSALQFNGSSTAPGNRSSHEQTQLSESVTQLASGMIRAFDLLMYRALVPREMHGELTKERSKLSAFVTRNQHSKGVELSGQKYRRSPILRESRSEFKALPSDLAPAQGKSSSWMKAGI